MNGREPSFKYRKTRDPYLNKSMRGHPHSNEEREGKRDPPLNKGMGRTIIKIKKEQGSPFESRNGREPSFKSRKRRDHPLNEGMEGNARPYRETRERGLPLNKGMEGNPHSNKER